MSSPPTMLINKEGWKQRSSHALVCNDPEVWQWVVLIAGGGGSSKLMPPAPSLHLNKAETWKQLVCTGLFNSQLCVTPLQKHACRDWLAFIASAKQISWSSLEMILRSQEDMPLQQCTTSVHWAGTGWVLLVHVKALLIKLAGSEGAEGMRFTN